jgi:hypothetical protein
MPIRRKTIIVASTLGALAAGSAFGAAALTPAVSGAASSSSTTAPATATSPPSRVPAGPPRNFDPTKGGHTANGITEQLLTGDTATKVRAAALAAVPGGTIERVENDAEGSPYEAHMTKADGTEVTVKFDKNFTVTAVETGMGKGDPMNGGPHGPGGPGRPGGAGGPGGAGASNGYGMRPPSGTTQG